MRAKSSSLPELLIFSKAKETTLVTIIHFTDWVRVRCLFPAPYETLHFTSCALTTGFSIQYLRLILSTRTALIWLEIAELLNWLYYSLLFPCILYTGRDPTRLALLTWDKTCAGEGIEAKFHCLLQFHIPPCWIGARQTHYPRGVGQ